MKTNRIIMSLMIALMLIGTISAMEIDNWVSYNEDKSTAVIENAFGLGRDLATIKRITPQINYVPIGKDIRVMEFEVDSYDDLYLDAIGEMRVFNMKTNSYANKEYHYEYAIFEEIDIPIFETSCKDTFVSNGTTYPKCKKVVIGTEKGERIKEWKDLETTDFIKGKIRIALVTDVNEGDYFDGIPILYGKEIKEWAIWTVGLNVDLERVWHFDDVTGTTATEEIVGNDLTVTGLNWTAVGIYNGAYYPTGDRQNVSLNITHYNDTGITVSVWFRDEYDSNTDRNMLGTGDNVIGGSYGEIRMTLSATDNKMHSAGYVSTDEAVISPPLAIGAWTHIVSTWNKTGVTVWHNGTKNEAIFTAGQDTLNFTDQQFRLWTNADSPVAGWSSNTSWDELYIWSRVLSDAEITSLYDSGVGSFYTGTSINITLEFPLDDSQYVTSAITHNCSVKSESGGGIINNTLVVDGEDEYTITNTSEFQNLSLQFEVTGLSRTFHNWSCYSYDSVNGITWADSNRSYEILDIQVLSEHFNNDTTEGNLEFFQINVSTAEGTLVSSASLVHNNTIYAADVVQLEANNYTLSRSITIPEISADVNVTFNWNLLLNDGADFNSTLRNQTIFNFVIDKCTALNVLILNYTLFDEDTLDIIPNPPLGNLTIEVTVDLFSLGGVPVGSFSGNYSKNNAQVCVGNNSLLNSSYLMDVITRYDAGGDYISEFHHIQKFELNNDTIPQNIALYDLLVSRSQEFLVTFKDDNFIRTEDIIVDLSRLYVADGTFRSVEIGKTDTNGETLLHLVLGDVVYTATFKKDGEILAILDNFLARCTLVSTGVCTINVNAFSSTLPIEEFVYVEGVNIQEGFEGKTITLLFDSNSGVKTISLNATKFDRFGNQSVCSDVLTSSSGSLTCTIPDSFGNVTVLSQIYSDGEIISQKTYTIKQDPTEVYGGSIPIMALLIIITLSMLFIGSIEGVLLGAFLGLVMVAILAFVNLGNMFFVGGAMIWIIVAFVIIFFKLSKKEEDR